MKYLKRQLRLLLLTQIPIWLEYGPCDTAWLACARFLAQLRREAE